MAPPLHTRRIVALRGDHPVPGANSFAAAAKIAEVSAGPPRQRRRDRAHLRRRVEPDRRAAARNERVGPHAAVRAAARIRARHRGDERGAQTLLALGRADASRSRSRRRQRTASRSPTSPTTTSPSSARDRASPDTTTADDVTRASCSAPNSLTRIPQTYRDYLTSVGRGAIPETPTKAHPAFAHVTARVIGNNRMAVDGVAARARSRTVSRSTSSTSA